MTDRIRKALELAGVSEWLLAEKDVESAELFFVKKELDTRRFKDTVKYDLTVYVTGMNGDRRMKGANTITLVSSISDEELERAVRDAALAASYAMNEYYDSPDPAKSGMIPGSGRFFETSLQEAAGMMAKAAFGAAEGGKAYINSLEVFAERKTEHILSSWGTDVAWESGSLTGEYVVQCKEPEDVEMFFLFRYDGLEPEALASEVRDAVGYVSDKAVAGNVLRSGNYDLLLTGENLAKLMGNFYARRSSAGYVYAGYSSWKPGDAVQTPAEGTEALTLTLRSGDPFSGEGIPMKDLTVIREGTVGANHGGNRFCRYLGITPTGDYSKAVIENAGSGSFADMKKRPCLWPVMFSAFDVDDFSGSFGGEVRMGYYFDGEKVIPVSGCSVNGNILEAQNSIAFSTDRYVSSEYEGPYAVRLRNVNVAGI